MAARLVGSRSWNSVARAFRSDMIYEDKPQGVWGGRGGGGRGSPRNVCVHCKQRYNM